MARLKPTPITTEQICSVCDLDWDDHPDDASVEDCINLLKANNANSHKCSCRGCSGGCCHYHHYWHYPYTINMPYAQPTITGPTWTGNTYTVRLTNTTAGTPTAELTTGGE